MQGDTCPRNTRFPHRARSKITLPALNMEETEAPSNKLKFERRTTVCQYVEKLALPVPALRSHKYKYTIIDYLSRQSKLVGIQPASSSWHPSLIVSSRKISRGLKMNKFQRIVSAFLAVGCCALSALASADDGFSPSPIGWGVQKLKNLKSKSDLRSGSNAGCENVEQLWFEGAVVDNFAPVAYQQNWAGSGQRYWLNKQLWGGVGFPIFVFIGGEGAESCSRLTDRMYLYDIAKEHQGLLVDVEHRFYGESYPTEDMSTRNLKYLSSQQALADLARIIGFIKQNLGTEKSEVITVGGSYPGNLAAWFRLKYPSVTSGSIASSAPVTAKANFFEYMEVVGQSVITFGGQKCYDALEEAAVAVAELAAGAPGSTEASKVENDFKLCSPITNALDTAVLLSDLMGNVQGTVQYNNEHAGTMNVTDICEIMLDGDNAYDQFVALTAAYREASGLDCEDASWNDTASYLSAAQKDPSNNARPWTYQTCNEFGYYQTTQSDNQPFSSWEWINMKFSIAICAAAFNGWTSLPETSWMNQVYGDVKIAGSRILFPSGTIDPWHALGVTNYTAPLPPTEIPVFIEGTAHCADLYQPMPDDPCSLTWAREVISGTITQWLSNPIF